ncbi:hypothetical protein PRUPE_3G193000 [Prunus persica]|uniref:25S rRNA (uridine-N(3))-methyltransferase BMT5-like domain-containing protein n=1 Tax=Prunus persica TaxID=3760 RepID=A0A251Q5V3_PRUPE|nr:uncharacterized protein LOC18784173 isoform X2 [Prunus persica]ONI18035.1 hypothetical protein PRUPE_3G193000 [Prunus persica]
MGEKQIWIGHYSSSHKILLVGEGDFSFSACLARAFRSATNMVATTLESEDTLLKEHWSSEAHVDELQRRGCKVLHEVDVYDMDQHPTLMFKKFDMIVFNFPHAGHDYWLCERDNELIRHRGLLEAFFRSASGMLGEGGEIHVSHREGYPYDKWKLKELAKKAGLVLKEKVWFEKSDYPGYHQKRGGGIESNKTFPLKECYTFKFSLKHETSVLDSEEATSKLQRKLEELHLPQHKTFIPPNHIHVPESERFKLTFGSFGAADFVSGPETDKSSHIMSGCGFRVSISNRVRKAIQDSKEITGNHSEEEIYAMLKRCYMDPNETAQKLLYQDPFHEVKGKRDKRKEKLNNIESAESPWRSGMQGREDAGDGGNSAPRFAPSLPISRKTKNKQRSLVTSSGPIIVDGPTNVADGWSPVVLPSHLSGWDLCTSADGWSDVHPSHLSDGWSDVHAPPLATGWEL